MKFTEQLKKHNLTLYQINEFILNAKELGYGEIEFTVKTHNYVNKVVEMKAVKPEKETLPKSVTKRVVVNPNEGCKACTPKPGGFTAVDDVKNPHCSSCGRNLLGNRVMVDSKK